VADKLDLQGQLAAGRDLTLQAQETVKVRDAIASPVIVTSARNLTIQGNMSVDILALSHPQSKIQSGGNLSLISDGNISGDAHFFSGGSVSMLTHSGTPGNFISEFDPIIYANGDVRFGNYTGVALKVEATGSIQGGDITITGADTTIPATDPDFATLTGSPSVILRAGLASVNTPNLPQKAGDTDFTADLGLPLGITVRDIDTFDYNSGNGGDIILWAAKGSITTRNLSSSSFSPPGGNAAEGGAISLIAANNINITGNLSSNSFSFFGVNAAEGGAISLIAANGSITTGYLSSSSFSVSGKVGNGGAISLIAANGSITTGNLFSDSFSVSGKVGNGGAISLIAANDINITGYLSSNSSSVSGNAAEGGAISLIAANDINITGRLYSYSSSVSGNAAEGGAISLIAANGSITTDGLYSFSSSVSGNAAEGGAIGLTAANDIKIKGDLYSFSYSKLGTAGQGGAISLIARGGDIVGIPFESTRYDAVKQDYVTEVSSPILGSFSISFQGTAGNGGNVALEAKNNISNLEILTLSSSSQAGAVQVTGLGDLLLTNTNILTSKQLTVTIPFRTFTLNVDGEGQSGDVAVTSSGNLTLFNSSIQSDTKGSGTAGNVTISSPGLVTFNNSRIISNTSSTGQAGSITLKAPELQLDSSSRLSAQTSSSGGAGDITLQPDDAGQTLSVLFQDGAQISASTSNLGTGGNLKIKAPGSVTIQGEGTITTSTTGEGNAGNITLDTSTLTIARGAQVFALTDGSGDSGTITVNAPTAVNLGLGVDDFSPVLSVETSNAGKAGSIIINTPTLTLSDTARITATATNTATNTEGGGSITLNASTMHLAGIVGVFAETQDKPRRNINPQTL
jgi:hypothetical protein